MSPFDSQDTQPFRLLDLPTELRLQIAEHALRSREPLIWTWITYDPNGDTGKGTFKGLDSLTAITRASRQLHAETTGLVWKSNTFRFDEWILEVGHRKYPAGTSPSAHIEEAYNFFYRLTPETTRKFIKSIRFRLNILDNYTGDDYLKMTLITLASCSDSISSAQFAAENATWAFSAEDVTWASAAGPANAQHRVERLIRSFKSTGREIQSVLSNLEFGPVDNLRIMPSFIEGELRSLDPYLKAAD